MPETLEMCEKTRPAYSGGQGSLGEVQLRVGTVHFCQWMYRAMSTYITWGLRK